MWFGQSWSQFSHVLIMRYPGIYLLDWLRCQYVLAFGGHVHAAGFLFCMAFIGAVVCTY